MISRGLRRVLKYLDRETLYTSVVVSLVINQTREDVSKLKSRGELDCIKVCRDEAKPAEYYEAETVARYLGKPVCEVRHYLNMARLTLLMKDRDDRGREGGVANHQRSADDYYHNHYRQRATQVKTG